MPFKVSKFVVGYCGFVVGCGSVVTSAPACSAEGPGFEAGPVQTYKPCADHESCRITVHGHKHCEPANCLGQLSLLPVTGMVNECSFGWEEAATNSLGWRQLTTTHAGYKSTLPF